MKGKRLNSALVGLLVLGLVVPTGAAMPTLTDSVFESNDLVLRPYDGPNGRKYVSSVEDTRKGHEGEKNITIDVSKVNLEAQTQIDNVFVIANDGDETLTVWVTHNASAYLTIERSDTHDPIQGRANRLNLSPGESIPIGFSIDTEGTGLKSGELLLQTITIHVGEFAKNETTPVPTETPPATTEIPTPTTETPPATTEIPTPTTETPPATTEIPTPTTETPPATNETEDIEVTDQDGNATEVTARELEEVPSGEGGRPQAVVENVELRSNISVTVETEFEDEFTGNQSEAVERALRSAGAQAVTEVGRPVNLTGEPSVIRSTGGVDGEGRIVKAWDIDVPAREGNDPVTLRLDVPLSRFPNGSDPANATIGHFTGQGWQLLETRLVRITDTQAVYETEVTSFSPFAVFAENEVRFEWTLPDGTVFEGRNVRTQFDEVGIYNVTLTVIDAFGQSDSTNYRILVNDRPQPRIEVSGETEPGEPVTLHANVTDEMGEITGILWIFQDGTRVFNETVTVKFGQGTQNIRLVVRDVYGSVASTTTQLQIGGTLPEGESAPTAPGVPNAGAIILVGLGAAFTFLSGRWAYPGNLAMLRPVSPRVSALRNPTWTDGSIRIEELRVEDPNGDLERVLITVLDSHDEALLEKEIELDPTYSYEAGPERIQAPMLRGQEVAAGYEIMVQGFDEQDHASRRERQAIGS